MPTQPRSINDDGLNRGDSSDEEIVKIIAELDREYTGQLPRRAIRDAQRCRLKIVPHLIKLIRKATEAIQAGQSPPGEGHLFALYLLTEFRAKEALPEIVESISLPDDGPFDLYGDAVTEDLSRVLAALADDSPEILDELIANRSLNEYVRWGAAQTYLHLVRDQCLTRDAAVQRLRQNLHDAVNRRDSEMATGLVAELVTYAPLEAQDEIEAAFREKLVDLTIVRPETVEQSIAEGETWFQRELSSCRPTGIDDTVEELDRWAAFEEQADPSQGSGYSPAVNAGDWGERPESTGFRESAITIRNDRPQVGRNDPCPCGSGRKHKKCCGRAH